MMNIVDKHLGIMKEGIPSCLGKIYGCICQTDDVRIIKIFRADISKSS